MSKLDAGCDSVGRPQYYTGLWAKNFPYKNPTAYQKRILRTVPRFAGCRLPKTGHFPCQPPAVMITDVTSILDSLDLRANPNILITAIIISLTLVVLATYRSYRPRTTKLRGPPNNNFIFGVTKELFNAPDLATMYRNWEKIYGPVYEIPSTFGSTILVLQDPGAITHLYSKDTLTYHQNGLVKAVFGDMVSFSRMRKRDSDSVVCQMGDAVIVRAEGENHKRFILRITYRPADVN